MMPPFAGPRLKVKRGYHHINTLERWVHDIMRFNREVAAAHDRARHADGEPVSVVVNWPPHYFAHLPAVVGDAVHNLRSALDLAACDIVSTGGAGGDVSNLYFPIAETWERVTKRDDYARITAAAPALAAVIADVIRPYHGGGPIWALHELDKADKHRVLITTVAHQQAVIIAIREEDQDNPPPIAPGAVYTIGGRPGELRRLRPGSAAYLHNQQSGYASVELRFGDGEIFEGEPVLPKLHEIAESVRDAVDALEAALARNH